MELFEDLRERIAKRRVVAIVGAGASIAASGGQEVASWKGLLDSGITRCGELLADDLPPRWIERMREDLASNDTVNLLSVASQVQHRLEAQAPGELRRWLEETIGKLELRHTDIVDALRDLEVPIATTNYDNLLEAGLGRDAVSWTDPARIQRVLQGDDNAVIHLHGHYREPESVVLGYMSYAEVLASRGAQELQHTLRANYTLLYVGFGAGFEDPNFSNWLAWARETFQGEDTYRHYRLCREKERQAVQQQHLSSDRIFALSMGPRYEDLAPFLRRLAPDPHMERESPEPPAPKGLPPADWLLGRDRELADLVAHLCAEGPAPVPILGGPGIGKTALSIHAFRHPEVLAFYGERRYFVRCEGVTDSSALPGAIANEMNLPVTSDPWRALLQNLGTDLTLLVLDNFETPWDSDRQAAETLLSELAAIRNLAMVVSIRGIARPHGVPWRPSFDLSKLKPKAAAELFHKITEQARRDDPDLERVLSLLDGVPLAIRLMGYASRPHPALSWLLDAWARKRTSLMSRGHNKDDDLEVSIALSLDGPRLSEADQRFAAHLAILPSGLAFEDIETLFGADGRDAATALVEAGLAFFDTERLRMLSPLREAIERLRPLSAEELHRVVRHYLVLVSELGPRVGASGGGESVLRLKPEIGNLEMCFRHAVEGIDPEKAFAGVEGLTELIRFQNIGSPQLLNRASRVARSMKRLIDEANCIQSLGDIALARSDHDRARERFEQALLLYRDVGSVLGEANCIQSLGDIALDRSNHDRARERFEQALPLYRNVGSVLGEANCIQSLGDIALRRSDHDRARERFEQALPLFRNVGSVLGEANCIKSLGDIALRRSQHDRARERFEKALPLYRNFGDVLGEANCIRSLGDIALRRSDHDRARERFEQALLLYRDVGSVLGEANCIQSLGNLAEESHNLKSAGECWQRALILYRKIPEPYSIGWMHRRLASLASEESARQQHLASAREAWGSIDRFDLVDALDQDLEPK